MKPRSLTEFIRDNTASKSAQRQYRRRAADLSELAHDQEAGGLLLTARKTRYQAFIAANAARAEYLRSGRPRMTAYRPKQVDQLDGSKYAGLNCTCAAGAMALDRDTLGKKTSTGAIIRNWTGDTVGGTRQAQVADAIERAYGVELDVRTPIPTAEAMALLDAGHGMMLAGQEGATKGTKWQGSETFTGNHQWYDNERRKATVPGGYEHLIFDPLADGRRASIARSPFWIPEKTVLDFARRLNISATPDKTYVQLGYGRLYAVFTHDTEPHLTLRFGAHAIPRSAKTIHVPKGQRANVRTGPNTGSKVVYTLANGRTFIAYQVTTQGQELGGSRTWYGNIDGTRWTHASSF